MSEKQKDSKKQSENQPEGITEITVSGFKSISEEKTIAIRPLTVLAGANSSGKSSIMQPLLLMKQTLESSTDHGALNISDDNVQFNKTEQLLSQIQGKSNINNDEFSVKIATSWQNENNQNSASVSLTYKKNKHRNFDITNMRSTLNGKPLTLKPNMTHDEIMSILPEEIKTNKVFPLNVTFGEKTYKQEVYRDKCFLALAHVYINLDKLNNNQNKESSFILSPSILFKTYITDLIHISGLMNRRKRTFPVSAVGESFPGLFEDYFASVIRFWEEEKDQANLDQLKEWLIKLSFTRHIETKYLNDTEIELMVDRLPPGSDSKERDLVSVADVGVGVSQTLPILVALLVARPGQLVYIEQPELHLHPKAQHKLSEILSEAANRGVRVVIETHSDILIRGIQTQVAKEKLDADKVILHWFERQENGATEITKGQLSDAGTSGKWPQDFGDTVLKAEGDFIESVGEYRRKHG